MISSQPRYDHFDTAACFLILMYRFLPLFRCVARLEQVCLSITDRDKEIKIWLSNS